MSKAVDVTLAQLRRLARRKSGAGEPVWYLVMAAIWLLDRARRNRGAVLWRGPVAAGQALTVTVLSADQPRP